MDLQQYMRILRKRWLSIAIATALGVALAATATLLSPRVYQATAQNFVAIGGTSSNSQNSVVYSGSSFALQRVKSYVQIVDSPEVLAPVIEATGVDMTVPQLAAKVTADNPPATVLLTVTVADSDPNQARELANAVATSFARQIEVLETPAGATEPPVKVTVTSPAALPTSPVSPNARGNIFLGLLLGLGAGVAYALLREQLDTSIKGEGDLSQITNRTNLGILLYDPDSATNPLVALNQQSLRSEGFRTMRTNLQYVDVDNPPRAVVITSSLPSEGKTTTSCNLAITLAQAGMKVCLIEADLRKPKVADYLGIDGGVGLVDLLTGSHTLDEVQVPWQRGLFTVIPSGPIPPNPSEILASQQMAHLLDELKATFDVVVIDAPPLLPVTDAAILAGSADGAILVTRFGKTTREQLRKATEVLDNVGARLLGTVLNFVPSKGRGYGGYGYGYGYGYGGYGYGYGGYGYGHDEEEKASKRKKKVSAAATESTDQPADNPAQTSST